MDFWHAYLCSLDWTKLNQHRTTVRSKSGTAVFKQSWNARHNHQKTCYTTFNTFNIETLRTKYCFLVCYLFCPWWKEVERTPSEKFVWFSRLAIFFPSSDPKVGFHETDFDGDGKRAKPRKPIFRLKNVIKPSAGEILFLGLGQKFFVLKKTDQFSCHKNAF